MSLPARPARSLPHVGTYTRELPVSLERLYENALDWEHLPWLHASTFSSVALRERDRDRWCAAVGLQPAASARDVVLELALDRACRRWITTTLDGPGAGTEIWTHAFAVDSRRTDIVVDFFVPGVRDAERAAVGAFYRELYGRLYDEDVWMMTVRQDRLDDRLAPRGAGARTVEVDGEVVTFSTVCPHLLGPLDDCPVVDGIVQCPWHGYRFDVRTGENVDGRPYRLRPQ